MHQGTFNIRLKAYRAGYHKLRKFCHKLLEKLFYGISKTKNQKKKIATISRIVNRVFTATLFCCNFPRIYS